MKKSILLAAFFSLLVLVSAAHGQFAYVTNSDGTLTITGYTGSTNAVTIPASIDSLAVTGIDTNAFEFTGVTNVAIPASVNNIEGGTFIYCAQLTAITVDTNNPTYSSLNGVLFDKNQTTLIQYPCGLGGNYTIPDTVTSIEDYAFYQSQHLSQVTIPVGVTNIGASAFDECGDLTNAAIPAGVITIGTNAFAQCGLTSILIPGSVVSIGDSAFYFCIGVTNVTISPGVKSIGSEAFFAARMNEITIPASVTIIETNAFGGCFFLTAITVDTNNPNYSSVNGVLFDKDQKTLIQHPVGDLGSYTIPNSVTSIGDNAFAFCNQISVTIPASVTSIGAYAFAFCSNWRNVTIPASVTNIGPYAFREDSDLTGVFFGGNAPSIDPTAFYMQPSPFNDIATNYYLPGATGWPSSTDGLPALLWNPFIETGDGAFGVRSNQFGFNITGTTNIPIVVERSSNLENPAWAPLVTNALADGLFYFSDPFQTNISAAFYRISAP